MYKENPVAHVYYFKDYKYWYRRRRNRLAACIGNKGGCGNAVLWQDGFGGANHAALTTDGAGKV
jgi:hypothetical protein